MHFGLLRCTGLQSIFLQSSLDRRAAHSINIRTRMSMKLLPFVTRASKDDLEKVGEINLHSLFLRASTATCFTAHSAMASLIKPFSKLSVRSALPALARQASTSLSSSSEPSSSTSPSLDLSSLPPLTGHNPVPRRQDFPSRYPSPVHKHLNQPQWLSTPSESEFPDRIGENEEGRREEVSQAITGMTRDELRGLRKYTVVMNRVVKMTKKGKM